MATPAEVIEQSMASGFDEGLQRRHQNQDFHRQTEWQDKHTDLRDAIKNTQQKLWNLDKSSPDYAAQHAQGVKDLTSSIQAYQDFLHPTKNPGMWEKVRSGLGMDGKPHPLAAPERISSETTPGVEASTTPAMGSESVTLPASAPTTITGPNGQTSSTTPQDLKLQAASVMPISTPALPSFKTATAGPAPTLDEYSSKPLYPSQVKERAKRLRESQKEASLLSSGAPPSAEDQAVTEANAKDAGIRASIKGAMKSFVELNPDATPEEKQSQLNDLIQKYYAISQSGNWTSVNGKMNGQPTALLFDKKTRQYRLQNGESVPQEMLATFIPDASKATESSKVREDYAAYKQEHPEYQGTLEQWTAEQRAKGAAAGKPKNRDDRFIEVEEKKASGQPITEDDKAFEGAYNLWVKKTKVDPGVARAAAFGAMRYVPVLDPKDPQNVILMRAGEAAQAGVGTPASIGFQTDKAITRYMTSGQGGTNINYFNTATDHLKLLKESGMALQNGELPAFNKWANQYATATGDPAPTNFETVKAAVAGELSKTFKGTGATDAEISDINQTINQAQSPEQINGAIDYYTRLMDGKINALKSQYEAGAQGHPNFGGTTATPAGSPPAHQYKHFAKGPNNHRIGTNDDPHSPDAKWFDAQTGKPI